MSESLAVEVHSTAPPNLNAAPQKTDAVLEAARSFIELLAQSERGELAALKRNAGENLPGRGVAWFPSLLRTKTARRYEEIFFLVATLYGLNRDSESRIKIKGNLGNSLSVVAEKMRPLQKADEARRNFRRFYILLDASFDVIVDSQNPDAPVQSGGGEMAFRLRQLVKLCASKDVGIDWPQLIADLCRWNMPGKRIQKKWARAYFGQRADAAPENELTENQNIEVVPKEI